MQYTEMISITGGAHGAGCADIAAEMVSTASITWHTTNMTTQVWVADNWFLKVLNSVA